MWCNWSPAAQPSSSPLPVCPHPRSHPGNDKRPCMSLLFTTEQSTPTAPRPLAATKNPLAQKHRAQLGPRENTGVIWQFLVPELDSLAQTLTEQNHPIPVHHSSKKLNDLSKNRGINEILAVEGRQKYLWKPAEIPAHHALRQQCQTAPTKSSSSFLLSKHFHCFI